MPNFRITLGDTLANDGEDYGQWEAESATAALLLMRHDQDGSREYEAPVQLSTSSDFGRAAPRKMGNGNGAADRRGWWYVESDGRFVGIYTVAEVRETDPYEALARASLNAL